MNDGEITSELISWLRTLVERGEQKLTFHFLGDGRGSTDPSKSCRGAGRLKRPSHISTRSLTRFERSREIWVAWFRGRGFMSLVLSRRSFVGSARRSRGIRWSSTRSSNAQRVVCFVARSVRRRLTGQWILASRSRQMPAGAICLRAITSTRASRAGIVELVVQSDYFVLGSCVSSGGPSTIGAGSSGSVGRA